MMVVAFSFYVRAALFSLATAVRCTTAPEGLPNGHENATSSDLRSSSNPSADKPDHDCPGLSPFCLPRRDSSKHKIPFPLPRNPVPQRRKTSPPKTSISTDESPDPAPSCCKGSDADFLTTCFSD
ncbi:hypothetical protein GJAV_G00165740 [Gymnothorax javanicus]|nr:hypothetical protein GJAV_G00165740 [Gymnothorax javanicus]